MKFKGNKMLPFVAGVALGIVAVSAFNNKDKLKNIAKKGFDKSKDLANDVSACAKNNISEVKEKITKKTKQPKTQVAEDE